MQGAESWRMIGKKRQENQGRREKEELRRGNELGVLGRRNERRSLMEDKNGRREEMEKVNIR